MGIEIIAPAILSLLGGGFFQLFKELAEWYVKRAKKNGTESGATKSIAKIFSLEDETPISYKERIADTLSILGKASKEIDAATNEFNSLMKEKLSTIEDLETKLHEMSQKEQELSTKIQTLQNVPLEVVTQFEAIMNKGDKRSAMRDYTLFGLGVVVSAVVSIILKQFGF